MALRLVKTILALFIGLICVFYALQNVANIHEAHFFMGYVLGNVGHEVYPNTFAFGVTSGAVAWIALTIVIALELLAGILALFGAWNMWQARSMDSASFQAAKNRLYLGAGVALIVWFGLFTVIAGSFFQMWQTELGAGSLAGSFQYLGSIALVTFFIAMPDTE